MRDSLRLAILGVNYAPEPTGIAPYTTGVAEGLRERGHEVRVFTSFPHYPQWAMAKGLPRSVKQTINGVYVERHRHFVPNAPKTVNRALLEGSFGARLLTSAWTGADVVVGVSPALLACTLAFMKARALKSARPALGLIIQDLYSTGVGETGAGGKVLSRAMACVEGITALSADGIAVIHERFAQRVHSSFGVDEGRIRVIRNWTHVAPLREFDRYAFRSSMGWKDDEVVVLHAGAMGNKQGLESVVEAARIADVRDARLRFVLLGDGSQRRRLEAAAHRVERVQFLDPLDEDSFLKALQSANVLLLNEKPGVVEMAVPSKLTSYFSAGRPVLAATEPGSIAAAELEAAGAGVQIPPGSPELLLDAALRLAGDERLGASLGQRGRRYAQRVLSEEAAIDAYDAWVRELAARRSEGSRGTRWQSVH